jgi:photosystem II stability/assembly factor-like uncharacterized protein
MIRRTSTLPIWFLAYSIICIAFTDLSFTQTTWVKKLAGSGLGNPFCVNPWNDSIIYGAVGTNALYISRDRGESWRHFSTIAGGSQIKSVAVSARDTNVILVAQEAGPPDRIMKTTDNGATWYATLQKNFYYWGVPLAYCPQLDDDTVYTMGSNIVYRSTNFGETWDSVRINPFGTSNQGWEYAVIRPDSSNILIVADNTTGIWKSTDYGVNWRRTHVASSEVPALALAFDHPRTVYGARWSGGGGFVKSTDGGETWAYSNPLNGINTWGVDVSKTYSNYLITGTFGPPLESTGGIYISRNGATTWTRTYQGLGNSLNYACLVLDTLHVFVLQGDGIYKLDYPPTVWLVRPNGGESLYIGQHDTIEWNFSNVTSVRLDYSTDNGANWILIDDNIPADSGSYVWLVPNTPSALCKVRVQDASNPSVSDQSDSTFTITGVVSVLLTRPNGGEEFLAGAIESITWTYENFLNVSLDFSTNNGATWINITPGVPASDESYDWNVPHLPSQQCLIRITNADSSLVSDVSDATFVITESQQFSSSFIITDNGNETDTAYFGEFVGATDGIDTSLGEAELSPKPAPGTFDVRWSIPPTNGSLLDFRNVASLTEPERVFVLELQPGIGGYPMTLRWNPSELFGGKFFLQDELTHGDTLSINMLTDSLCVITNPSITSVEILHTFVTTLVVPVNNRWNIISVPLQTEESHKDSLFPTSVSDAYMFDQGYVPQDTLAVGTGYWLKFNGGQNISITGSPILIDSVDVVEGWNLIGSLSAPIPTSTITTEPPSIIASSFYGFDSGYYETETILPGYGYWVKVLSNGKLILSILPGR